MQKSILPTVTALFLVTFSGLGMAASCWDMSQQHNITIGPAGISAGEIDSDLIDLIKNGGAGDSDRGGN